MNSQESVHKIAPILAKIAQHILADLLHRSATGAARDLLDAVQDGDQDKIKKLRTVLVHDWADKLVLDRIPGFDREREEWVIGQVLDIVCESIKASDKAVNANGDSLESV
ncbi:MAG: hypothetical protein RRB13_06770 [bacterium]|nr:hypothetical protein [bacterium]